MRIALVGAGGGFGYSLLSQLRNVPDIDLAAVCDLNAIELRDLLSELGYNNITINYSEQGMDESSIHIVEDYHLIQYSNAALVVEATGNPEVSTEVAEMAIKTGKNVLLVSKEADSVSGAYLDKLARDNGVRYILSNGDQPKNLLDLISLVSFWGLEIVAVGKSSEYDLIYDAESESVTCQGVSIKIPGFTKLFNDSSISSIRKRKSILGSFCIPAPPDYCEMSLVANRSEYLPDTPTFHSPVLRINEIADAFSPEEDGGLLSHSGCVDVFYHIREKNEASFAGGEFVVVRCCDQKIWDMLKDKGHVISHNGKYAAIYHPYHLLGLEAIGTIRRLAKNISENVPECQINTICAARAAKDIRKGTLLKMGGHHHVITEALPELVTYFPNTRVAPYYLLSGKKVNKDIRKGEIITVDDIETDESKAFHAYLQGLEWRLV